MGVGPVSLEGFASFVRDIGDRCTLLQLSGDRLIAGSHKGEVACWSISRGSEIWRVSVSGPCSDSDIDGNIMFFTESDKVHAINLENGDFIWSVSLEGSSDLIRYANGGVWATSSVYELEIQDYTEASVWLIDRGGKLTKRWEIEGRAWTISAVGKEVTLGLSRPRCGFVVVSKSIEPEYFSLENHAPITTGLLSDQDAIFLGHSDGGVSELSGEARICRTAGSSSISSLDASGEWIAGLESGLIVSGEKLGSWIVETEGKVDFVKLGFAIDERDSVWASSWSNQAVISIIELRNGAIELEALHAERIGVACSSGGVMALGDDIGNIFLFEQKVLERRLNQAEEEFAGRKNRALLRSKIRNLRSK